MSVYPPSGSGNAHMDKAISGKKKTDPKKAPAKKAAPNQPFPPKKSKK